LRRAARRRIQTVRESAFGVKSAFRVELAKQLYAPDAAWSMDSVGYFVQSVLQGAFIFAKAKQTPEVARESLAHLRRYLEVLFTRPRKSKRKEKS
jgi:hypothetical protein